MAATILHIDDDKDILFTVRCILEKAGYEVVSTETVERGMELAEQRSPDLIILDVMVEEFDSGLNSYMDLHRRHPDTPVIFLTSLGDQIRPFFPSSEPMVWILEKPVESDRLLSAVESRLASASA